MAAPARARAIHIHLLLYVRADEITWWSLRGRPSTKLGVYKYFGIGVHGAFFGDQLSL